MDNTNGYNGYNGANGAADPTIAAIQDVMEAEQAKGNNPIRRAHGRRLPAR